MPVPTPGVADHAIAVPRRIEPLQDAYVPRLRRQSAKISPAGNRARGKRGTVLASTGSDMPGAKNTLFHIDTGL